MIKLIIKIVAFAIGFAVIASACSCNKSLTSSHYTKCQKNGADGCNWHN